jgi:hypothetical protein
LILDPGIVNLDNSHEGYINFLTLVKQKDKGSGGA